MHDASPSRLVQGEVNNILDLVLSTPLTDDDGFKHLPQIGHSDHCVLTYNLSVGVPNHHGVMLKKNYWKIDPSM